MEEAQLSGPLNKQGAESIPQEIVTAKKKESPDVEGIYHQCTVNHNFINEHIPTLYDYGRECEHITECGIESCISSWAFLRALRDNGSARKRLVSVDLNPHPNIVLVKKASLNNGVDFTFMRGNDLYVEIEPTDLLFIDTWHVYGHLKRELNTLSPLAKKYIIMHDTTVDDYLGENLRRGWDINKDSLLSGYPVEEIGKGLWPAVEEFLEQHKDEWRLKHRYENCNGLTILERISGPV